MIACLAGPAPLQKNGSLLRYVCACGSTGLWLANPESVSAAHAQHVAGRLSEADRQMVERWDSRPLTLTFECGAWSMLALALQGAAGPTAQTAERLGLTVEVPAKCMTVVQQIMAALQAAELPNLNREQRRAAGRR